jgi:hypothetical protein
MKPKDIVIAAVLIIIIATLFNGCGASENAVKPAANQNAAIQQIVKKAESVSKDVKMVLTGKKNGSQLTVKITLDNPKQKPITSVQTWLGFDADKLQGKQIDTSKTAFSLMAPYANTFDNKNGLVMLGRSSSTPITDKTIEVADVVFDVTAQETIMIDAYDYRDDLTGHTSVNTIVEGLPYNILIKPESPALVINK